jgi:arginase
VAGYVIIEAPSVLGLFPGGVEHLPEALLEAGLADALGADHAGRVIARPYDSTRDPATGLLNPTGLRDYAHELADATGEVLDGGGIPMVLGGDCSILLGSLLALRRRGRFGLLFIDGHADFYQPDAEPHGEAASMDLALATGRGPSIVADLEGRGPLVLDCDVLDDAAMSAVDYRLPGGLSWGELETVIRVAIESGGVVGLEVTIFNPALDSDGGITRALVACLIRALDRGAPHP